LKTSGPVNTNWDTAIDTGSVIGNRMVLENKGYYTIY